MNPSNKLGKMLWNRSVLSASIVYLAGSVIILNTYFHDLLLKELFCSWLLVFFNAFIGAFVTNQAVGREFTAFMVWGMLMNGFRIGIFVLILLVIFKTDFLNNREFAAITLFGYLTFLGREVYYLHTQSLRVFQNDKNRA